MKSQSSYEPFEKVHDFLNFFFLGCRILEIDRKNITGGKLHKNGATSLQVAQTIVAFVNLFNSNNQRAMVCVISCVIILSL